MQRGGADRDSIGSHGGWQTGQIQHWMYLFQVDESCMHIGGGFKVRPYESVHYLLSDNAEKEAQHHWASYLVPECAAWRPLLADKAENHPHLWARAGADDTRLAAWGFNELVVTPPSHSHTQTLTHTHAPCVSSHSHPHTPAPCVQPASSVPHLDSPRPPSLTHPHLAYNRRPASRTLSTHTQHPPPHTHNPHTPPLPPPT